MKYKLLRFSLLSMLVMLFGGLASAEEVTLDFTTEESLNAMGFTELPAAGEKLLITEPFTYGDITITPYKGSEDVRIWGESGGGWTLRYMKPGSDGNKGGIGISVPSGYVMTQIVITGNTKLADTTADKGTIAMSGGNKTLTWTSTTGEQSVIFLNGGSSTTNVKTITVTYQSGGTTDNRAQTILNFIGEYETEGTVGDVLDLPEWEVVDATGASVDGPVSWSSSNGDVAEILTSAPQISLKAAGTAKITAKFEGDNTYKPSEASFTVTVSANKLTITSLKELQEQVTETSTPVALTLNNVQVTALKGTSNAYLCDENGYGALLYTKNHGLTAGQVLNGTIDVNFMLYKGATEITDFTTEGLTITEGTLTPVEKTLGEISIANQSMLVTVKGLTFDENAKTFSDGTNSIAYYDNFGVKPTLEDGKKYDVTGIVVQYNNLQLCPRTAEDVVEATDTPVIPDNALWYSDEPVAIDWSGAINIADDKFTELNAKVGDIIHVEIVDPSDGGQVLPKSNWKDIEGSKPVDSNTTEVSFIITGDMMKLIKAGGLMIAGQNCSTKLVTLETTETTGSDESIWLGQANGSGNFPINYIHFVNANDGEGVKAGDILHITATEATGDKWLELFNSDWSSKLTADGFDITITEDFVDKLKVQYSSAYINFGGYNITQVELLPAAEEEEPHLYVIGDMNGWDRAGMLELGYDKEKEVFEYSITVDKPFYMAFADKPMTQQEADNDLNWEKFNASYRLAPQEGNFTPTLDEQVQLIYVDGCIVLEPGTYTFYITKDLKMTVTGEATPIVEDVDYIVAGSPASIFGDEWNPVSQDNRMAKQDDGTYAITYNAVAPQENIELKVVEQGGGDPIWHGNANGGNVVFNVTSECDVTITIDPATKEITVTGDGVAFATEFEYESVYVAGNGNGSWLNGENWTPNAEANKMTKVADDVWECTVDLSNIALDTNLEFKFTIDGAWTHNFGGSFIGFNEETDAVLNGDNIVIPFSEITSQTFKLRLDLSNFDLQSSQGAKFSVRTVADVLPVADLGTAYNMLELGEEPVFVDIELKNARVTMVQQVKYGEFLEKLDEVGMKYYKDNGAKQGLFKAPKKDVELDTPMDFAIIEDETGAMPFLACFLEDNGVSEGSVLNGDIVVILSNDFFPLALGDELEEHITDKMTATSLQALEVTDGSAEPTEITADNAEEYKSNFGFRYVKFSESELTVGSSSSEEQRASTLKLGVIDETVDIGDFLGTDAILDEDGTVSVEGFMYEMFGAKLFQPTKMESGTNGINSVRFFENAKGTIYNLNGQRVTTPQKGVMIVNGKKVVVK